MPNYSGEGGRENADVRGDLLAFSVARQAALGQEEIFKAVKGLREENEKLLERCKALGREVSLTQAENKQLAGHISRVLGLVTSFTQAQASSNNEVRSVLTAQVLALTEHVSALTKQFTIFQLDQRQHLAEDRRGSLVCEPAQSAAAQRRQLCDSYIALCSSVSTTPAGSVLSALTTRAGTVTLVVADLRDLWALTETLKSSVDVPDEETRRQWEKEAAEAAEAAAAPVLSRMTELLTAMDTRARSVESITEALDADGQATADDFTARVAAKVTGDTLQTQSPNGEAGQEDTEQHRGDTEETVANSGYLDHDEAAAAAQTRVGTPPPSSGDLAGAGEVDGETEGRHMASAVADMPGGEPEQEDSLGGDSQLDAPVDGLDSNEKSESTAAPHTTEGNPETQGPVKASPTIRHLRIRGDPALCLCEEAVALLTDLFSCYRMETVELPRTEAGLDETGAAASLEEAAENELVEAAKTWAARTGVALRRR